jgi:hypothetical protein
MMLIISLVLALLPLLGIVWIVVYGSPTTVDGLFTSLILLAMSGILGLNALLELRKRSPGGVGKQASSGARLLASGGLVQRGKVQNVQFFEAHVGQPNKSIVTLANGASSFHMLVLEGDMRNALPVGQRVEITFRKESGHNVLVNVNYA